MNLLVSACLLGMDCRYCLTGCRKEAVVRLANEHHLVPVCPEQMGGLPTPRTPVELLDGRAWTRDGKDVTQAFEKGAREALKLAKLTNCTVAVLKSRSPSCGIGRIYDGTFSSVLTDGNGVTAQLLTEAGIRVVSEEEVDSWNF